MALFAAVIILAAPCAALIPTVMGASGQYTPPGVPTAIGVGQVYNVNLRDYLGSAYDPWFNGVADRTLTFNYRPDWLSIQGAERVDPLNDANYRIVNGHLTLVGTAPAVGSYALGISWYIGDSGQTGLYIHWEIDVSPQSQAFTINMLAGDTFSYQATTSVPSTFTISAGTLSTVGLTHSAGKISGTAALGKQTVTLMASSNDGGPARFAYQDITFNVFRPLTLSGSVPPASWAGAAYSTTLTAADVDPDATGEVSLALNSEATTAGYTISKVSETSWTLARTAAKNIAGSVLVKVTATTSAGGISQSKTISTTVATYTDVGITSTPGGHKGTGTTIWLVEGDATYTYTVTGTPDGVTFSATGLTGGMTFASGKLTVPTSAPIPEGTVTITASSSVGGSTHTATQTLKVRVWDRLVFTSEPSVSNIATTIDGRTITASVVADNYTSIVWDMGDGTTYEGVTSVKHTYQGAGSYTIRVTVSDDVGREASSVTAVFFGTINPGAQDPGADDPKDNGLGQIVEQYGVPVLAAAGVLVLVAYALGARHPLVLICGIALLVIAGLIHLGVLG